jgi:hypothetical protein
MNLNLPPVIALAIAAVLGIAGVILKASGKTSTPFAAIVKSAKQLFVTPEGVAQAARELLDRTGIPMDFQEWIADTITQIVAKVPSFKLASEEHLTAVASSAYSNVKPKVVKAMFVAAPAQLVTTKVGRKVLAKTAIESAPIKMRALVV